MGTKELATPILKGALGARFRSTLVGQCTSVLMQMRSLAPIRRAYFSYGSHPTDTKWREEIFPSLLQIALSENDDEHTTMLKASLTGTSFLRELESHDFTSVLKNTFLAPVQKPVTEVLIALTGGVTDFRSPSEVLNEEANLKKQAMKKQASMK